MSESGQRGELMAGAAARAEQREASKDSRLDGNEFLDVILPIAQPTSEPGLTCSGLDAGIEIDDIVFANESEEVKSGSKAEAPEQGEKPESSLDVAAAELPEERSLNAAEVVGNLPVTTIEAGEPNLAHHGITTTAGENEQTITIAGASLAPPQPQISEGSQGGGSQAQDQAGPVAAVSGDQAPKTAQNSCVVNMASDDEQRSKEKESERNEESEAVKAPAKRSRRPAAGKKGVEASGAARSRAPSREPKQAQVSFDLTTQPFTDAQQIQLRAQILVYGAVIQGALPDESLMGAAFIDVSQVHGIESLDSQLISSKSMWEKAWKASHERVLKALASGEPTSPPAKAKPSRGNKSPTPVAAAAAATGGGISSSDLTSGFPLANSVLNMASATISSWNSARSRQAPLQPAYPGPWGIPPSFQPPLPGWSPFGTPFPAPAAPPAVSIPDERSKGIKRKRDPATPAAAAGGGPQLSDISPATAGLIEDAPRGDNGDLEKRLGAEELVERLISAKQKAEEAASAAAGVVEQSQSVWDEVKEKRRASNISSKEAQLASSFAAVTAAASVAKAAAAAANVAYAAALQSRALANDLLLSGEESEDPTVIHVDDRYKALVSGAKAAAKEQAQAASFALTRAENLDAVIRAAELAAEAASQAGRVMAIGDPSSISLVAIQTKVPRNVRSKSRKKDNKEQAMEEEEAPAAAGGEENEKAPESGPREEAVVDGEREPSEGMVEDKQQSRSDEIVVGSHVEIAPDEEELQGVWFSAKVVSLDGDQATVVYDELLDDDGSGKLEEEIDIRSRLENVPRVRIAHPMTKDGGLGGARKRRRASLGNQIWIKGDHVDVWIRDGWWEGIVQSVEEDESLVTVYFPGDGDSEVTKSWNLRPTLVWQDEGWRYWRELHPSKKQKAEESQDSQRTGGAIDSSSKSQKKPAKRRKFSDVIEKDQEARKQQEQQQQQQSSSKKVSNVKKTTSSRSKSRRGGASSWGSRAKKRNSSSEITSDSKDGEARKSVAGRAGNNTQNRSQKGRS